MRDFQVTQEIQQDPFTFVELVQEVTLKSGQRTVIKGQGFAKRNPMDQPNEAIGLEIATDRAKTHIRERVRELRRLKLV